MGYLRPDPGSGRLGAGLDLPAVGGGVALAGVGGGRQGIPFCAADRPHTLPLPAPQSDGRCVVRYPSFKPLVFFGGEVSVQEWPALSREWVATAF